MEKSETNRTHEIEPRDREFWTISPFRVFVFTICEKEKKKDIHERCFKRVRAKPEIGEVTVCVVPKEDMGKKVIGILVSNGKDKWVSTIPEMTELLKKIGVPRRERDNVVQFVEGKLRSLMKQDKSSNVGAKGFGFGSSEKKEV